MPNINPQPSTGSRYGVRTKGPASQREPCPQRIDREKVVGPPRRRTLCKWPILAYLGISSPIYAYLRLSWLILAYLCLSWPILAYLGISWLINGLSMVCRSGPACGSPGCTRACLCVCTRANVSERHMCLIAVPANTAFLIVFESFSNRFRT